MWKCIFSTVTNRGVAFNRTAQDGEFMVEIPPSECGWFASTPERYQYVEGVFSEVETWEQEVTEKELTAAKTQKVNEITEFGDKKDMEPFEYPAESGVFYKVTDAILNTITYCDTMGLPASGALPVNDGNWDNVDGTVSTPMTVSDLKLLYQAGYSIPATNYQNVKTHVAAVMALATKEEVESYDYSQGWV